MSIDVTFDDASFEMQITSGPEHPGSQKHVSKEQALGRSALYSLPRRDRSLAHATRHGIPAQPRT